MEWINHQLHVLPLRGRPTFPLPPLWHLLGREILVAIVSFLSARIVRDRFTGQPTPTETFELCLLPDMMATLLFKIYLALSHRLGEKGKKTVHAKRELSSFKLQYVCLFRRDETKSIFHLGFLWRDILSKQNQKGRPLKVYTWLFCFFPFSSSEKV